MEKEISGFKIICLHNLQESCILFEEVREKIQGVLLKTEGSLF